MANSQRASRAIPVVALRDEQKVAELARSYTREAIETLVELMRMGNDERVRGTAAQALLERVWAKA